MKSLRKTEMVAGGGAISEDTEGSIYLYTDLSDHVTEETEKGTVSSTDREYKEF